jgi:rRNA maturation endonuclease Nob1
MNLKQTTRMLLVFTIALIAAGVTSAQTAEQPLNVRIVPATTVEERVANEAKEKQLREKQAAEEAARIEATNPKALLSHARLLFISSNTTYFEAVQLENALRKLSEVDAWQLAMIDEWQKRDVADTHIEIDRPFFTFTYTYKITNRNTGIVLATGKLNAMDSNAAAPMLAERIVDEIRKARGEAKKK